jgi:hypothetical protein
MRKIISISILAILFILSSAIYDPSLNIADIKFQVINYAENGSISVPVGIQETQNNYLEIVWSTGDTGRSIIINAPGTYRVSIKDKWKLVESNKYSSAVFVKGLPDGVRIDTIIMENGDYMKRPWDSISDVKTILTCENGKRQLKQYTEFLRCYDAECDSLIWTEAHPVWNGFWSGVIDSITLTEVAKPLVINANVLLHENSVILKKVWDVSH